MLDPLKIVIENFPEGEEESLAAAFHPQREEEGIRHIPFTRELYIEQSDFMENPTNKYFRLAPGKEVRLRHAYVIRCHKVIHDEMGNVIELRCTYDKDTLGKKPEGRKVKGVIHWVSAKHAVEVDVYEYDRLFLDENPARDEDFFQHLNDKSLEIRKGFCEPALAEQSLQSVFQFERIGYYCVSQADDQQVLAFHRVVSLKDTWGKLAEEAQHA